MASGNAPEPSHTIGEIEMIKKRLGAAALVAMAISVMPAYAAKMGGVGCSGPNLEKTEAAIEAMSDGDAKYSAEKEVAMAQDALLSGKLGVCGMHLSKAMQAGAAK
jgi:hypothetical protein